MNTKITDAQLARHDKAKDYQAQAETMAHDAVDNIEEHCVEYTDISQSDGFIESAKRRLLEKIPLASLLEARDQLEGFEAMKTDFALLLTANADSQKVIDQLRDQLGEFERTEPLKRAEMAECRKQLFRLTDMCGDAKKEHWTTKDCVDWLVACLVNYAAENDDCWKTERSLLQHELDQLRSQLTALQERLAQLSQPEKQIKDWVFNANELQKDNNALREKLITERVACKFDKMELEGKLTALRQSSGALYNWIQGNVTIDERTRDVMDRLFKELDNGVKEGKR